MKGGTQWHPASPAQFAWLQARVAAGRREAPLFDTGGYVRALETRLLAAAAWVHTGRRPASTRDLLEHWSTK
jgi:hypothetical protein